MLLRMITLRPARERGHFDHGWLDTSHTFSFADYFDPRWTQFGALRVLNEDRVAAASGFGTHGHRDMEILTFVLEGALEHRDSLGTGSVIRPGDVQRMSAGTGVRHSETNPSKDEAVHFLQVWIVPERTGIAPGYEQKAFDPAELRDRLRVVASRDGREGSLTIHQDASVLMGRLGAGARAEHPLAKGRLAWVHVARGSVELGGRPLAEGDGAGLSGERAVELAGTEDSEVLVFDLPPDQA
jgi:redox-sensitive bicupin YhaK (pirin superfamily)